MARLLACQGGREGGRERAHLQPSTPPQNKATQSISFIHWHACVARLVEGMILFHYYGRTDVGLPPPSPPSDLLLFCSILHKEFPRGDGREGGREGGQKGASLSFFMGWLQFLLASFPAAAAAVFDSLASSILRTLSNDTLLSL